LSIVNSAREKEKRRRARDGRKLMMKAIREENRTNAKKMTHQKNQENNEKKQRKTSILHENLLNELSIDVRESGGDG
jgi:hypothetical protein